MHQVRLIISYDGTHFLGWQKTRTGASIQEALEKAAERILGHPVSMEAASRTDRGVHAEGQVVSFQTDRPVVPNKLPRALNAVLPPEIVVRSAQLVPPDFHPTLSAHSKEYHYWICNSPVQLPVHRLYSWHIPHPLDIEAMRAASCDLLGTHDFSAFSNERTDEAVRSIQSILIEKTDNQRIVIKIRADRFLYKMMRNIVGTLAYIGCGKLAKDSLPAILASKQRKNGGVTAPGHGLFLIHVFYP